MGTLRALAKDTFNCVEYEQCEDIDLNIFEVESIVRILTVFLVLRGSNRRLEMVSRTEWPIYGGKMV